MSTIEAIVQVLGQIEDDPERFGPLLVPFRRMVEHQIACAQTFGTPWRHTRRHGQPRRLSAAQRLLQDRMGSLVAVAAEGCPGPGHDDLLRLVARRVRGEECLDVVVTSQRALGTRIADHIGLPLSTLHDGVPLNVTQERWRAFVRKDDVLVVWGSYARPRVPPLRRPDAALGNDQGPEGDPKDPVSPGAIERSPPAAPGSAAALRRAAARARGAGARVASRLSPSRGAGGGSPRGVPPGGPTAEAGLRREK
ncbi:MAG: DTW domain-containing protein [Deltaproteobacteria bacterium]|nr:DTW domain-containing protein [Deltaproteobacteria bacterium]